MLEKNDIRLLGEYVMLACLKQTNIWILKLLSVQRAKQAEKSD